MVNGIEAELNALADESRALSSQRFFKTGPGEYGEGDKFLGITVPVLRKLARQHERLDDAGCEALLHSAFHEARLLALLILVRRYEREPDSQDSIYRLYLDHTAYINNWDLVDSSAPGIIGRHLYDRDRAVLLDLARSESIWERRIAIIATLYFIKQDEYADTFRVADVLLRDSHDLIQKGVGWMLREVGNRAAAEEVAFLNTRYQKMPRTMLRYAIEKFPPAQRQRYLKGEV